MKYRDLSRGRLLFFLFFSFLYFVTHAENFTLTSLEYSEVMRHPEASYVCLDPSVSEIKQLIIELSKIDKDRQSPLHQFKRYIRGGFNVALYDEVIHVLEYAELVVQKRMIEMGGKKIKDIAHRLSKLIVKVINKELYYDITNNVARSDDLSELVLEGDSSVDSRIPTVVFSRPVEIEGDLVVRKNERVHGSLKIYGDTFLENQATVGKDLVVEEKLRVHGAAKFYDNAYFKDSAQFDRSVHFSRNVTVDRNVYARTVDAQTLITDAAQIESLSATDVVIENLEVVNCIPDLCVDTLSVNDAVIQSLIVPGGIVITDVSFGNLSALDAVITDLTVLNCMDDLCVTDLVVNSFNTAGVVHNDASGNVTSSLIVNADITTGTINNDKLADVSSSDIPSTLVLRDGIGNFAANMITLNGTVTNPTDATTKEYVDNASVGLEAKAPALVVSTTNITLSGLQVIDSVALSANDRVLLVGQTNPVQNGLWLAQAGAWTRPADFVSGTPVGQAYVLILSGSTYMGSSWLCNTPTAIINTDPITFVQFSLPNDTTGANVGVGTGLIFRDKTGSTLNFKSLIAGNAVTLSNNANDITLGVNATSSNTPSTLVQRDISGNFGAGTITANLIGNSSGFTGSLTGDVTGTQNATVVSFVGGQSAASVASAVTSANSGTSSNTPNTLVKRDGSGNFSAGTITATLNGTATSTVNFTGSLSGDVTGTQSATVVSFVGGQTAADVSTATALANAATSANTASTIVRRNASGNFSAGTITATLNGNSSGFTGSLAGDVTGTQGATVVSFVGGQSAATVAGAAALTSTATSSNTPNTLVLRNGAGNFSAGIITATLNGNAATATNATTAVNFSGALSGDVTGTQGSTTVSTVGGQTAANVASGSVLANAATNLNTANAIVRRDGSGNFFAGTITGNLSGSATNFSGALLGDVTGTQAATVVSFVGGQSAANVASAAVLANAATSSNTASTIVRRDGSGNFSAGTITANLNGTATNFSGALLGDVTGVQAATTVSFVGGQSAVNVAAATVLANAATNLNTPLTIVRRDGSGNFYAGLITTTTGLVLPNGGSTLDYYFADSATPTFNVNVGSPASLTPTVLYTRIGNIVTVTIEAQSFTVPLLSTPQFYTATGAIPSGLRPTQGQVQTVFAPLIGLNLYDPANMGTAIINSSGDIIISRDANQILPWAVGADNGWDSITVSYCV